MVVLVDITSLAISTMIAATNGGLCRRFRAEQEANRGAALHERGAKYDPWVRVADACDEHFPGEQGLRFGEVGFGRYRHQRPRKIRWIT